MEKKRLLFIALGVIAAVVAITAAAALLWNGGANKHKSGNEVPYPYTWTEKSDGSVELTLMHGAVKNGAWQTEDDGGGVVSILTIQKNLQREYRNARKECKRHAKQSPGAPFARFARVLQ